jgi:Flp pilus assembly protein TadG
MAIMGMLVISVLVVVAAFAVELSMFMAEKTEMQRSADAAALAACWEYVAHLNHKDPEPESREFARTLAGTVAGTNLVRLESLDADANLENSSEGDIVFGNFSGFGDPFADLTPVNSGVVNAVKVRLRQTSDQNGEVRFTLARLFGIDSKPLQVDATASISSSIKGFKTPGSRAQTIGLLPFAVKESMWNNLMNGNGSDNYSADVETGAVAGNHGDGFLELDIYPHNTGASGNSGTVDIGSPGNSTNDIKRQIVDGVSADDLSYHDGKLELNANGELILNGDTGISAGMSSQLESIIGQPRIIMIYSQVTNPGNNAVFTIVKFVGVRIVAVNFQGSKNKAKYLIVQPANVVEDNAIVSNGFEESSYGVYAPAVLVH